MIEPGASSLQRMSYAKKNITLIKFSRRIKSPWKNGYPTSFIHSSSLQVPRNKEAETDCDLEEKPPLISILYVHIRSK